jgi:RNA polymerase sigma factor (sigma-70 family)
MSTRPIVVHSRIVFIVDDDTAVCDSLALLLRLRGFETQTFASAEAFLQHLDAAWRGCLLLDLRMSKMSGLELQATLAERGIALPIIIVTAHGDVATTRQAFKGGAFDFVEKPIDADHLLAIIEKAMESDAATQERVAQSEALRRRLDRLTERERQVFEFVVAGRHNREIAAELGISARTVEVYKSRMMQKLQVERLPDLIRLADSINGDTTAAIGGTRTG